MPELSSGMTWCDGGICAARGFRAGGVHAGFRRNASRRDLALVVADEPCATAATFTQNVFCAAPVRFSKAQLEASSGSSSWGSMRAVVINSGNANAATGAAGLDACVQESALVADVVGCAPEDVLVASTGVIGVPLPMQPFEEGLPKVTQTLSSAGGHAAAEAILTTDTCTKECAISFEGTDADCPGVSFTVGGMAKGSGMIMPNMATMIAVVTTDAPIQADDLYAALARCVAVSFNRITVDSDTSTNDTCIAMASGLASASKQDSNASAVSFGRDTEAFAAFERTLLAVCTQLAREMARDGEGATRLIDVTVRGARTVEEADMAARTIANSPLVKTAIAGHDANWGRIAAAVGRSGAHFCQEDVDISIMGLPVCKDGLALVFDEDEALVRFEQDEIALEVDLKAGDADATVWTCDLTHDYISINADYRT